MHSARVLLGLLALGGVSTVAPHSGAAPPGDPPATPERDLHVPSMLPTPSDSLAGHVSLFASGAVAVPFGSLSDRVRQQDLGGTGYALELDAAVGVSRTVALGAWGQAVMPSTDDACSDCSVRSLAFGPFVRYHLVQGLRFDPWASAGLGVRLTNVDGEAEGSGRYVGIEWLRAQVGGDWYAFRSIAFGPFLELDVASFFERPEDSGDVALAWHFLAGLRLGLDIPGKN